LRSAAEPPLAGRPRVGARREPGRARSSRGASPRRGRGP
jgi:hypothetical protein